MDEVTDKIVAGIMICFIVLFFALLFVGLTSANAEKLSDDIGIYLSDSCIASLKTNPETSPCPDYGVIETVFPDTTLPQLSGGFVIKDGLYQRELKHLNNHYEYYRTNGHPDNWLDPPADVATRIKMIEIHPSLPEYKIKNNSTLMNLDNDSETFSRFLGHSRYVTPNCMNAAITSENWLFVLGDTIQFLHENCDPTKTQMNTVTKYTKEKTQFDIKETRDYQHKLWIQMIKDNCLSEYGKCK